MDTGVDPAKSPAPTRPHIWLARNLAKFFGNRVPKSDLDVPEILKDIDAILESRSTEDGRLLLRGMVADLLKEVDLLRFKLDEVSQQLVTIKEERDVVNNDYNDRLQTLLVALQTTTDSELQSLKAQCQNGTLLSPDQATQLTLMALTQTIEQQNTKLSSLETQLTQSRETAEDVESKYAAQTHKLCVLEQQFKDMNVQKRRDRKKVVTVLADSTKQRENRQSPATDGIVTNGPDSKQVTPVVMNKKKKKVTRKPRLVTIVDP